MATVAQGISSWSFFFPTACIVNFTDVQVCAVILAEGWKSGVEWGGWREGVVREFGMDMYTTYWQWIIDYTHRKHCSVSWQPGWERRSGENGYMYMYGWVPSLLTWNYHNNFNWRIKLGEESACNAGDKGSIPRSQRSPGEGNGNLLQYSCLGNPTYRGAWQTIVHGVTRVGHDLATKPSYCNTK